MPRSNRPRRGGRRGPASTGGAAATPPLDLARARGGNPEREQHGDGDWFVRPTGGEPGRSYRCPGCDQEIPSAARHLVVWPAEGILGDAAALADRRHWHAPCWRARDRRRPR